MSSRRLIPFLFCLVLLLTGCSSNSGLPITDSVPSVTLPPAEVSYVAPIGDAALEYTDTAVLYLPSHDGISLTEVETELSFSLVRPAAETIIRALVAYTGTKEASALGGDVKLSLYGANPVEVSRDAATVNLSASALQLDRETLYTVCQAITNTLTRLDDIQYVNVLVVDKPVGLDIANTLPMGALKFSNPQDLNAVYDQLLSRRPTFGSATAAAPLSASVLLYFPLQNSDGMVCESRTLSFENQRTPDMITTILREIAAGPTDPSIGSTELPLLADLLTAAPEMTEDTAIGGRVISLDFAPNLDDMLEAYGITRNQCTASLCYTLSSFFPNVAGISLSINGTPVDSYMSAADEADITEDFIFVRSDFSELIYDNCTLYFADSETGKLTSSRRAIAYHQRTNPRVLLCELAKGPQPSDSRPDLVPVIQQNAITDTTLLGFALSDGTLLTNFAPSFERIGKAVTQEKERLFAYSLVNTLCMNNRVKSVCFFLSGEQFETFAGEIYWPGLFYPLPV